VPPRGDPGVGHLRWRRLANHPSIRHTYINHLSIGTRLEPRGDQRLGGLDFDQAEKVVLWIGKHCQAHAGVFVEQFPAECCSEAGETVDLGLSLPLCDAEVEVRLLIAAGCFGAAVEVEPETVRGVGLKEDVGVAVGWFSSGGAGPECGETCGSAASMVMAAELKCRGAQG
jgi:hypothetical protein